MATIGEHEHGDPSSNSERGCLYFIDCLVFEKLKPLLVFEIML